MRRSLLEGVFKFVDEESSHKLHIVGLKAPFAVWIDGELICGHCPLPWWKKLFNWALGRKAKNPFTTEDE